VTTNQNGIITATIDPTMITQLVQTEYAIAHPLNSPTVINPTPTTIIVDIASPTLTLIPNTNSPTVTIIPTLSIVVNEITTCVPENERVSAIVTRIIDGDTIEVAIGEKAYNVRYIGIDCPEETSTQDTYGMEATQKNKDLVLGKKVILIKDISETDQYNRLLRYVLVDDLFINYELVAQGYASVVSYQPDIACNATFLSAEQMARNAQIGLWAPAITIIPTVPKVKNNNCDPAYPTVCIPSPPPDLNCKDIPYRNFMVLPPDPHGFDGNDNDGIGCEN
jgi:micrococcal nuclease